MADGARGRPRHGRRATSSPTRSASAPSWRSWTAPGPNCAPVSGPTPCSTSVPRGGSRAAWRGVSRGGSASITLFADRLFGRRIGAGRRRPVQPDAAARAVHPLPARPRPTALLLHDLSGCGAFPSRRHRRHRRAQCDALPAGPAWIRSMPSAARSRRSSSWTWRAPTACVTGLPPVRRARTSCASSATTARVPGATRASAMRATKFVLLLDADVQLEPSTLTSLYDAMRA